MGPEEGHVDWQAGEGAFGQGGNGIGMGDAQVEEPQVTQVRRHGLPWAFLDGLLRQFELALTEFGKVEADPMQAFGPIGKSPVRLAGQFVQKAVGVAEMVGWRQLASGCPGGKSELLVGALAELLNLWCQFCGERLDQVEVFEEAASLPVISASQTGSGDSQQPVSGRLQDMDDRPDIVVSLGHGEFEVLP